MVAQANDRRELSWGECIKEKCTPEGCAGIVYAINGSVWVLKMLKIEVKGIIV